MCERGIITLGIPKKLLDVSRFEDTDWLPRKGSSPVDDEDAAMAVVPPKGAEAPPAEPARTPGV